MNNINNQFAKVFSYPDGQLLLTLEYSMPVVAGQAEKYYLQITTEREECIAKVRMQYEDMYKAKSDFLRFKDGHAKLAYDTWQVALKLDGRDIVEDIKPGHVAPGINWKIEPSDYSVHTQAFEKSNSLSCSVLQMFWLALEVNDDEMQLNPDLIDLLADMSLPQINEVFGLPPVQPSGDKVLEFPDDGQLMELIKSNKKFGFLAEVARETYSNWRFNEDGSLLANTPSPGTRVIFYVYAETAEDLLQKIEVGSKKLFDQWEAKAREEQLNS